MEEASSIQTNLIVFLIQNFKGVRLFCLSIVLTNTAKINYGNITTPAIFRVPKSKGTLIALPCPNVCPSRVRGNLLKD